MKNLKGALIALALTGAVAGGASAAEVTVLRGDTAEAVRMDRSGSVVLRGGGTMRAVGGGGSESQETRQIVAGDTLWFVDGDGLPRSACFLMRTEYAGKRLIRCTSRQY